MANQINIPYSITLIYDKSAILQINKTGEYLPYYFAYWKDAVHFSVWESINYSNEYNTCKTYRIWYELYGYDNNEKFYPKLKYNEFSEFIWNIEVFTFTINNTDNLKTIYEKKGFPKTRDCDSPRYLH